jgi:hypothetical protein
MARKKTPFPKLAEREALAALRWLHALGTVTSKQIASALRERERLVDEIKAKLEALGGEGARFLNAASFTKPTRRRRAKRVSAKARAAWAMQGRYIGAVRRLSAANRAAVKKIRETKGVRAAVAAAKRIAKA